MKFFDKFKQIPTPQYAVPSLIYSPPVEITIGKWVVYEGMIAIVTSVIGFPVIELHLVNAEGVTIKTVQTPISQVTLAKYIQIPEARRPVDYAYAAACLGYV